MQKNIIFFAIVFVLGLILTITSHRIDSSIKNTCDSDKLRNANRNILIIGVVFIVSSSAYMMCHMKCDCAGQEGFDTNVYIALCLILGIVLIILASEIKNQSKDKCDTKGATSSVMTIGVLMTVGSLGYGGYLAYNNGVFGTKSEYKYSLNSSG